MIVYSIILDFNNPNDTYLAYKSLVNQKLDSKIDNRIIVVDNGSKKTNQEINRDNFTNEEFSILDNELKYRGLKSKNFLIILESNLGFTGGNNIAINIAMELGAEYILLFNNDAVAEENILKKLIDNSGKKSITGGAIFDYDDRSNIQTLGTLKFGFKGYSTVLHENIREDRIKVASVSGACMLLPTNILKEIGLFDDNFYLYSEENELSKRAQIKGYSSYTISSAKVYHKGSATLGNESDLKFYYLIRNNIYFHKKHSSYLHYLSIILYQGLINTIKKFNNISKLKVLFYALKDGIRNKMGVCTREYK